MPAIRPVEARGDGEASTAGTASGYQHLLSGKSWKTKEASRWDFLADEQNLDAPKLRMWLLDDEAEEIITATGIGYTINQKAPTLIRRREAASTRFVTAYDLSGRGDYIRKIQSLPGGNYQVETAEGVWKIFFAPGKATADFSHR